MERVARSVWTASAVRRRAPRLRAKEKGVGMSATTIPAVATAKKAGWGTRALAILIDAIGIGIIAAW